MPMQTLSTSLPLPTTFKHTPYVLKLLDSRQSLRECDIVVCVCMADEETI